MVVVESRLADQATIMHARRQLAYLMDQRAKLHPVIRAHHAPTDPLRPSLLKQLAEYDDRIRRLKGWIKAQRTLYEARLGSLRSPMQLLYLVRQQRRIIERYRKHSSLLLSPEEWHVLA